MLATATHDHKRGEDVRARLAVLSEIPEIWIEAARGWSEANAAREAASIPPTKTCCSRPWSAPGRYGLKPDDASGLAEFAERIAEWQQKALREGKLRSSRLTPNADYEQKAQAYAKALLDPKTVRAFLQASASFVGKIARRGMANSLTQVALRCLAPGVPDLYRGGGAVGFDAGRSDNRRPVDTRCARGCSPKPRASRESGALKLTLIRRLLDLRRRAPDLFASGDYQPIRDRGAAGRRAARLRAPPWRQGGGRALALRAGAAAVRDRAAVAGAEAWGEARLDFDLQGSGRLGPRGRRGMKLAQAFADSPVAVWARTRRPARAPTRSTPKSAAEPPT